MEDRHLSLAEVAGLLAVSERTVQRWIHSGKLKAYKPGRDYRIPESAVRALMEESEVSPKGRGRSSLEPSLWNGLEEEERRQTLARPTTSGYKPGVFRLLAAGLRRELKARSSFEEVAAIVGVFRLALERSALDPARAGSDMNEAISIAYMRSVLEGLGELLPPEQAGAQAGASLAEGIDEDEFNRLKNAMLAGAERFLAETTPPVEHRT